MLKYKPYLLIFLLLTGISVQAQKVNTATMAGEWIGFDNKGQKVTLVFTGEDVLQKTSMGTTASFTYLINSTANDNYLRLIPGSTKKSKKSIKWPLVFDGNDQLQIYFPQIPPILFTRKQEDKIKLSRFFTRSGDSIIQYTYKISYKNDSVTAVRIVHLPKPVALSIADTILSDRMPADQLELSKGWGISHSAGVVFNLAPSTGTFYIDRLEVNKAVEQPFSVCVTYWKNKLMNFFWLQKEDIIYPADPETALLALQQLSDRFP